MPLSEGFKKITVPWASGPQGERTDPDDPSLTPPIVIAQGWPAAFSADAGERPRRRVFNEVYFRRDSALIDVRNHGILPWDAEVDTLAGGIKQVAGIAYRALVDNGPTYANVTSPTALNQNVWEVLEGAVNPPEAPDAPIALAGNGVLRWRWNCPRDRGAEISEFVFQWRVLGAEWDDINRVTVAAASGANHELSGLQNGTTYEARVYATNARGSSGWSPTGTGTPAATVPGKVESVVGVGRIEE